MIQPDFLKEGDKVAIVAPAKRMLQGELDEAIDLIKSWKLIPVLGKNIYAEYDFGYKYAGTDEIRTEDFQWALDDIEIKAIWCARGGQPGQLLGLLHLLRRCLHTVPQREAGLCRDHCVSGGDARPRNIGGLHR